MRSLFLKAVAILSAFLGLAATSPAYVPLTFSVLNGPRAAIGANTTFKMSSDGSKPAIIILDYGKDVEGYTTFKVVQRSGDTFHFEISFSETRAALDFYMADGPLPLAGAMDTYRINRYNITGVGSFTNRLIQGGQRYQKLNLSSPGELELFAIGVKPSVDAAPITSLPGYFECSDPVLNRIWNMGARTVQMNELPAKSLPDFWLVTDQGVLIDSLAPQPLSADWASAMTAYTLDFSVLPKVNGFGFTVLSDTLGSGIYIFVNIANASISAHAGSTDLDKMLTQSDLPSSVNLNRWHTVHASVNLTQISVAINNVTILDFTQLSSYFGSFGLGASYGHSAVFRNVSLSAFGTEMYANSMTHKAVLQDFLTGTNPLPVSVDGSRRDRIAYGGDLDMTIGATFASTFGSKYVNGSIHLLGSMQMLPGFFTPTVKVQQPPRTAEIQANITGLIGYSFSLANAMAQYYEYTGDRGFLEYWSAKVARLFDWAYSQTLSNGLFNISDPTMGGDWNYYDPSLDGVIAKFNLVYAYSLKQWLPIMVDGGLNMTMYKDRLESLQEAIKTHLWSDQLQAYYLSESHQDFFSQEANALAILSDTVSANSSCTPSTILSTLARELYVPSGALSFSNASVTQGWAQKISPYASGFHLKAAFHANDSANAKVLLHNLWGPMSDPNHTNYTGCGWETLNADGTPGLGTGTSLCHAWSSGPTADLSRHVLGVQAVSPGFKQWQVIPQTLDMDWARGKFPTPHGTIKVDWSFNKKGLLSMTVVAPPGTKGTVHLPRPLKQKLSKYITKHGVLTNAGGGFAVQGGKMFSFRQTQ